MVTDARRGWEGEWHNRGSRNTVVRSGVRLRSRPVGELIRIPNHHLLHSSDKLLHACFVVAQIQRDVRQRTAITCRLHSV